MTHYPIPPLLLLFSSLPLLSPLTDMNWDISFLDLTDTGLDKKLLTKTKKTSWCFCSFQLASHEVTKRKSCPPLHHSLPPTSAPRLCHHETLQLLPTTHSLQHETDFENKVWRWSYFSESRKVFVLMEQKTKKQQQQKALRLPSRHGVKARSILLEVL